MDEVMGIEYKKSFHLMLLQKKEPKLWDKWYWLLKKQPNHIDFEGVGSVSKLNNNIDCLQYLDFLSEKIV